MRSALIGLTVFLMLTVSCGGVDGENTAATAAARIKEGMDSQKIPPFGAGGIPGVKPDQIESAARAALATALNVAPAQITIDQVAPVQWNDSSLGCSEPNKMYAQVITPGFRVAATVAGQKKNVHVDAAGRAVVCDKPTQ